MFSAVTGGTSGAPSASKFSPLGGLNPAFTHARGAPSQLDFPRARDSAGKSRGSATSCGNVHPGIRDIESGRARLIPARGTGGPRGLTSLEAPVPPQR
jgi:hypothetical protein